MLPRWLVLRLTRRTTSRISIVRAVASIASGFPLQALPKFDRVLLLAPHPDDEVLGAGGTAALLAAAGSDVAVVIATAGEADPHTGLAPEELGRRRKAEAAKACATLGLRAPIWLGLPDGQLSDHAGGLASGLQPIVESHQPLAVFLPWFGESHPDHSALGKVRLPDEVEVWAYEVWTPLPSPNRLVDISSVIGQKRAALDCHVTAARSIDLESLLMLSRYRAAHGLFGKGWAEAFFVASAEDYRYSWVETLGTPD